MPPNLTAWRYKGLPFADIAMSGEGAAALEQKVTEVFLELRQPVYRYLRGLVGDPVEAEDLTQEAFFRLFTDLRKGQSVTNVRSWVFRVAHNLAVDRLRRPDLVEAVPEEELPAEREDPAPTVEESLIERERNSTVRSALGQLSQQERNCVRLRSQGLRYREIADILAVRVPTVQTLLGRAVKKIVRVLE